MNSLMELARKANLIGIRTEPSVAPTELLAALADTDNSLKYSAARHIFRCISTGLEGFFGVFGDGDNGAYEWFIWSPGRLQTSNCGYGNTDIALRDVLLEIYPTSEIETSPQRLSFTHYSFGGTTK